MENISNICDNCSLFQEPINVKLIESWTPFFNTTNCSDNTCVPTALALTGVLPKDKLSTIIEKRNIPEFGITPFAARDLIQSTVVRKIENIGFHVRKMKIYQFIDFFEKNLYNGYITLAALLFRKKNKSGITGHMVNIAKYDNTLLLLEGQTRSTYIGHAQIISYIMNYSSFSFYYRSLEKEKKPKIIIRKNKLEPDLKKKRISPGSNTPPFNMEIQQIPVLPNNNTPPFNMEIQQSPLLPNNNLEPFELNNAHFYVNLQKDKKQTKNKKNKKSKKTKKNKK
jgi:hypothetical protein